MCRRITDFNGVAPNWLSHHTPTPHSHDRNPPTSSPLASHMLLLPSREVVLLLVFALPARRLCRPGSRAAVGRPCTSWPAMLPPGGLAPCGPPSRRWEFVALLIRCVAFGRPCPSWAAMPPPPGGRSSHGSQRSRLEAVQILVPRAPFTGS